jgi:hypothetical protein
MASAALASWKAGSLRLLSLFSAYIKFAIHRPPTALDALQEEMLMPSSAFTAENLRAPFRVYADS